MKVAVPAPRLAIAAQVVVMIIVVATAQHAPLQPTFRAEVSLVEVPLCVTDGLVNPVAVETRE